MSSVFEASGYSRDVCYATKRSTFSGNADRENGGLPDEEGVHNQEAKRA